MSARRCPQHPDGCPKHPNLSRPKPIPRRRPQPELKGSIATLVAVYHTAGSGNPAKRRTLVRRPEWKRDNP